MKNRERILQLLVWLAIICSSLLVSCQNEDIDSNIGENAQTLNINSNLTGLLSRASMLDTAADNVIDSTSCFKVKLPVDVVLNGEQTFTVNSEEDYETVASLLQIPNGYGSVDFVFPITVIFPDYSEEIVTNQLQFDTLSSSCNESQPQPIGCVTIQYPITIFGYDSNFQIAQTYVVDNDSELFLLLLNLNANEYYAVDYPISLLNENGQMISVNSNSELEALFQQAILNCNNAEPTCPNPHILINGMMIYMPFANETRDLISLDYATSQTTPTFVTDRSGNANGAISFNGENFLTLLTTENRNIQVGDSLSISVWVKMQNTDFDLERILEKSNGEFSTTQPSFVFGIFELNTPIFYNTAPEFINIFDPSWTESQTLPNDTENWHHIVITIETNQDNFSIMRLYRDGESRNTAEASQLFLNTQAFNYFIGKNLIAQIDDLRVYKKMLTAQEVNILFQLEGDTNTCF